MLEIHLTIPFMIIQASEFNTDKFLVVNQTITFNGSSVTYLPDC